MAGPYLYTFNRWAVSWLENLNIGAFISPYENSRKNLEATYEESVRSRVLVPVFAYPALFRMRFKMPKDYDFTFFADKEEKIFKLSSTRDGSFVMPEEPFSIVDKVKILQGAGFKKLLVDFSKTKVTRSQIKAIMTSLIKAQPLQGVSRFNWKDGFYSPEKIEEYKVANERAAQAKAANQNPGKASKPSNARPASRGGKNNTKRRAKR